MAALLAGALQPALAAPITCQAGAESVPQFDPAGGEAELGRITLDCGGGDPSDPAQIVMLSILLNAEALPTYTPWVSMGNQQTAGSFLPSGAIAFFGLRPEPSGTDLVVHNLWVDPGAQPPGFDYFAFLSLTGALVENPQQRVGRVGEPADDGGDAGQVPEPSGLLLAVTAWVLSRRWRHARARRAGQAVPRGPQSGDLVPAARALSRA